MKEIVLPYLIGETVFCVTNPPYEAIVEDVVYDYDIWSIREGIKVRLELENYNNYVVGQLGKTVFFTREEAESALEEMKK